jgi:hypothetical protein
MLNVLFCAAFAGMIVVPCMVASLMTSRDTMKAGSDFDRPVSRL